MVLKLQILKSFQSGYFQNNTIKQIENPSFLREKNKILR